MANPLPSEEAIMTCAKEAAQVLGVPYPTTIVTMENRERGCYVVRLLKLPSFEAKTRQARIVDTRELVETSSRSGALKHVSGMLDKIGGEAPILLKRETFDGEPYNFCWRLGRLQDGYLVVPDDGPCVGFNDV